MRHRHRIREYPPAVVAVTLAFLFFGFAVEAIGSSAGHIPTEAAQTEQASGEAEIWAQEAGQPEAEISEVQAQAPRADAQPETESLSLIRSCDWGGEDSEILLKIAMAEAEGEGVEGKALVMLVVLNRVWSDGFPGTISEVVFQDGQFSPTAEGGRYWTTEPDGECYEALELIEGGWDESRGALYFESCGKDSWHSRNLEFIFQYGNHKFYK